MMRCRSPRGRATRLPGSNPRRVSRYASGRRQQIVNADLSYWAWCATCTAIIGTSKLPFIESYVARVEARRGDRDAAIPVIRKAVNDMLQEGQLAYGVSATNVLVETLLDRGADGTSSKPRT